MRSVSIRLLSAYAAISVHAITSAADIDDEYHHTQLLQAKVSSGKAAIAVTDKAPLQKTGTRAEECYLAADNLWEPEDIPPYFECLKKSCQDFDPERIFDGMTCDQIIGLGFGCDAEVPGRNIPGGTTVGDVCSLTCGDCDIPAPAIEVGGGGCTAPAGEKCYLAEDNLWGPEDIPPYFDCLQGCCQDFDPARIFDGMTCDDIIAFGFGCDDEVPDLRNVPEGTTVSAFCSETCGACGESGQISIERVKPDFKPTYGGIPTYGVPTYGKPTYSSWSDWNMSHGGSYSNWSDWNGTYGNWSDWSWTYGNSSGNWSYWNWSSGNWSTGWTSGNWSTGPWTSGNWSTGPWTSGNWSTGPWTSGNWSDKSTGWSDSTGWTSGNDWSEWSDSSSNLSQWHKL